MGSWVRRSSRQAFELGPGTASLRLGSSFPQRWDCGATLKLLPLACSLHLILTDLRLSISRFHRQHQPNVIHLRYRTASSVLIERTPRQVHLYTVSFLLVPSIIWKNEIVRANAHFESRFSESSTTRQQTLSNHSFGPGLLFERGSHMAVATVPQL